MAITKFSHRSEVYNFFYNARRELNINGEVFPTFTIEKLAGQKKVQWRCVVTLPKLASLKGDFSGGVFSGEAAGNKKEAEEAGFLLAFNFVSSSGLFKSVQSIQVKAESCWKMLEMSVENQVRTHMLDLLGCIEITSCLAQSA